MAETSLSHSKNFRRPLSVDDYIQGVLNRDRMVLARTITLIESHSAAHQQIAQEVVQQLLPYGGRSIRLGITGVPGVGKSTFIEAFGCFLCETSHHVAVLAIDPSSTITGGSILGDKTRMERLSREPNAFIRPSPSGGTLGGVARKTRETMLLCEAAGFDVILLETVGVGQNEVTVRSLCDFMLLLLITGAGDELQGIKKGIIELADALVINKADGDNRQRALAAQAEYQQALHYLTARSDGWTTRVLTCSALTGEGIANIWEMMQEFQQLAVNSGQFDARRREQARAWLRATVEETLYARFYQHPAVRKMLSTLDEAVSHRQIPIAIAAQQLLAVFDAQ